MTSIFVAKLDFNTTDDELRSLFERHGKVNRVTIAKDRETGKPRGFAFVEMFDETEAEAAIELLDNTSVNGRNIAVKKADDRGSKPGGGAPSNDRPPQRTFGNGQPRQDNRPFRQENRTEERPAYKKTDEAPPVRPASTYVPADDLPPLKSERKKEKQKDSFASKDKPKQHKMEAYKKSGKANRFFEDDDDDDDWMLNARRSSNNGWDDEEEE